MDAEIQFISAFCSRSPQLTSAGKQRDQRALKPGAGQNIALLPRPAASQQIYHSCLLPHGSLYFTTCASNTVSRTLTYSFYLLPPGSLALI